MHPSSVQGTSLVGRVVNGHDIVRVLGEGGMGEVYIARHQQLGTVRALKVIHDDIKSNPSIAKRFKREAMVLGRLHHPNIVDVIDFGHIDNGWPFLLLEFVEGSDLHKWLTERGPMSMVAALEVLLTLARVLTYAHGQGVVHRDLKPGNVLVRGGDHRQLKVIDFGLAKLVSAEMLTKLTADQAIMGSPHYMAPEQALGARDIGPPADVYAVAGIGYQLLSGLPVFGDRPDLALVYAHLRETPERLSTRLPVPPRLDELLYACLDKEPANRPTTAQLTSEIEALLLDVGGQSFEVTPGVVASPASLARGTPAPRDPSISAGSFSASSPQVIGNAPSRALVLSKSMLSEQQVMSGADFIFSPLPEGPTRRVREAMQRQMLAIVGELADAIGPSEPQVGAHRQVVNGLESELGNIELDAAMVDADIVVAQTAGDEVRIGLEEKRTDLARRTLAVRRMLDCEMRELAVIVENRRRSAPPHTLNLYRELDDLIGRAKSLEGSGR